MRRGGFFYDLIRALSIFSRQRGTTTPALIIVFFQVTGEQEQCSEDAIRFESNCVW